MTLQTWREDEFEDWGFDDRIHTACGTTSSIIEGEPFPSFSKEQQGDMVYVEPGGKLVTIEVKKHPTKLAEPFAWFLCLRSFYSYQRQSSAITYPYAWILANQSAFAYSPALIDELWRSIGLSESAVSSGVSLPEEIETSTIEAVHPLTKSAYEESRAVPMVNTRRSIQAVLNQFAQSVSYSIATGLPPLRLSLLEDSSYLLEWTFKDRRLGFSFEQSQEDSGWYFVLSVGSSGRYESGTMDQLEMNRLIKMMLKR